ncbi:MAG: prolipoprotein diacylglyceryl transferase [Gemmiger sp.]
MEYHVQFPGLGLEFTVDRVALSIGGFNIYWYGILIALGMMLALAFAFHYAPDFGIDGDRLVDVVIVGAVMAIVCARIYYVAFAPFEYETIWDMIDIRQGGIAIYGAVIGAFVFGGLAARVRHVPILPLFDVAAMGFLIGQGIGRWGNFVNQEAFGTNTTLPWGMYSEGTHDYLAGMLVTAPQGVTVDPNLPVHPTFLYESLWCLIGFVALWRFIKKRRYNGQIFLMYITWYGLGRFWIEALRTDSLMLAGGLRTSQAVALASVVAAVILQIVAAKRFAGVQLMVPLAVADVKKQEAAGACFVADELAASASHRAFVQATAEMNARLRALDLQALPDPAPDNGEPVITAEPESTDTTGEE